MPELQHFGKKAVREFNNGLIVETQHFQLPGQGIDAEFAGETKARADNEQLDYRDRVSVAQFVCRRYGAVSEQGEIQFPFSFQLRMFGEI